MKSAADGYRVAVVGSASLLGQELLAVLKQREFPIARLITPDALDDEEPDLPVLDLSGRGASGIPEQKVDEADLDFAFLVGPIHAASNKEEGADGLPFLQSSRQLATATHCKVIDVRESLAGEAGGVLTIPSLERNSKAPPPREARYFISPHPANIVISTILLRLAREFKVESAVAHIFRAVSEIGPMAVEELQKQTLNLLSFQRIPSAVFGTQLAFNLLPRLGRGRKTPAADMEHRIQLELKQYLGRRAPWPALRLVHAPVFHSLACSLYVKLSQPAPVEALTRALAGEPIHIRKASEQAPSQVDAAGSSEIALDALAADANHSDGFWIWATADNLRLAAVNAVEIAENLMGEKPVRLP